MGRDKRFWCGTSYHAAMASQYLRVPDYTLILGNPRFYLIPPVLFFVTSRVPISSAASSIRPFDLSFSWDCLALIFQLGNIVEAIGYFLPIIYLPTIARGLGASGPLASLALILLSLVSTFGYVIMGSLLDRLQAHAPCYRL